MRKPSLHFTFAWKTIAAFGALVTVAGHPVQAQPPAKAEVAPQPTERVKKPRPAKGNKPAKQDKLVENFEAMFGRKLTADQLAQLQKATEEREAAIRTAQQAWRKKFTEIAGVTEKELKQKQREMRQRGNGAAQPAANIGPAKQPEQQPVAQ